MVRRSRCWKVGSVNGNTSRSPFTFPWLGTDGDVGMARIKSSQKASLKIFGMSSRMCNRVDFMGLARRLGKDLKARRHSFS